MTDKEKLKMYRNYMINRGYNKETIEYNLMVINLLIENVLEKFDVNIDNIDTYTFEEFTDMSNIIDDDFGGKYGIEKMLSALMDLTEFLKLNKFIKGGKIAHYKRMFSKADYYIDKYDMITGKKDDSKEYIKNILDNSIIYNLVKILDETNLYDIPTLKSIDKLLNDIPLEEYEEKEFIIIILLNLGLLENKNQTIEITKKGRTLSRLCIEERYATLIYLLYYVADWEKILKTNCSNAAINFKDIIDTFVSIFTKKEDVTISYKYLKNYNKDDAVIEVATDVFRISRIESSQCGNKIIDFCFTGLGLLDIENSPINYIIYRVTDLGKKVFDLIYGNVLKNMKYKIQLINLTIKNREYEKAESDIIDFLYIYGGNTIMWDYFGQVLLIQKKYEYAYKVLKYGYEKSSKRGKTSRALLYHLVLCCRKLKLIDDINNYENKLNSMNKA